MRSMTTAVLGLIEVEARSVAILIERPPDMAKGRELSA
jgi:hypothetical protein